MNCAYCGEPLPEPTGRGGNCHRKYCSARCAKRAGNHRYRRTDPINAGQNYNHGGCVEIVDPLCALPYHISLSEYNTQKVVYHMGGRQVFIKGVEVRL